MNGVQAVYHYPTLSESIDFRIVYLEIQETRKVVHYGEQGQAYEAFCRYQHNVMEGIHNQLLITKKSSCLIQLGRYLAFIYYLIISL